MVAAQADDPQANADLTLYEAALIAGLLKAPSRYNPARNPDLADRRAKMVLKAMAEVGFKLDGDRFVHPEAQFWVEFPRGPLAVGGDYRIHPTLLKGLAGQTRALTPGQVQKAFGDEVATFQEYRRRCDPDGRFYTPWFRALLEPGGGNSA